MRHVAHHHSRVCCCAIASERRSRGVLKTRLRRGVARATRAARAWLGAGFWAVRGEPKRHDETSNKTSKGEVLFFCALAWVSSTSLSTSLIGPEREVEAPLGRVRSERGEKGGISRRGVGSLSRRGRSGGKRQHSFSRPLSPALSSPSHSLSWRGVNDNIHSLVSEVLFAGRWIGLGPRSAV